MTRRATEDDVDDLVEFDALMAFETEGKALDKELVKRAVLKAIRNPKLGGYFVAYDDSDPERRNIGGARYTQ